MATLLIALTIGWLAAIGIYAVNALIHIRKNEPKEFIPEKE